MDSELSSSPSSEVDWLWYNLCSGAWDVLGMTGEEFLVAHSLGDFQADDRSGVQDLVRTVARLYRVLAERSAASSLASIELPAPEVDLATLATRRGVLPGSA